MKHRTTALMTVGLVLAATGSIGVAWGGVIEEVRLEDGHTEDNDVPAPVYDTDGLDSVSFGEIRSAYDADAHLVGKMNNSLLTDKPKLKRPKFKVDESVDLGGLFAEALSSEAEAMGFRVDDAAGGWKVTGVLHDVASEIRLSGGGFGPLLFYGYMDVEFDVAHQDGRRESSRFGLYNLSHFYNAGFGAQDEAKEALALFLVESAQEAVARLNRVAFGAAPHARMTTVLQELDPDGDDLENHLRQVGLSGDAGAVPRLLELLPEERDEGDRVEIINALANIGSAEAIPVLSGRYPDEDKDARVFTLKAMAYIGTGDAMAFIERHGVDDDHLPCRRISRLALQP